MSNVAGCDAAGCCGSEEVKEVVVFVSPTTAMLVVVVGGSFVGAPVGAIGGGGVSLTVFGFMLVVVCSFSNEKAAKVVQRGVSGAVSRSESIPRSR